MHNQDQGFFCGLPIDADLADELVDLSRRLDGTGDSGAVGTALTRLAADLTDEGLEVAGVNRMLEILAAVERRGELDLATLMARNLAADPRATAGIARREVELAGSANSGRYSELVLGDPLYDRVWGTGAELGARQDRVLRRINDPEFWDRNAAIRANEQAVADEVIARGGSAVPNPLARLSDFFPESISRRPADACGRARS